MCFVKSDHVARITGLQKLCLKEGFLHKIFLDDLLSYGHKLYSITFINVGFEVHAVTKINSVLLT